MTLILWRYLGKYTQIRASGYQNTVTIDQCESNLVLVM
jgi:hypothetical protein